jgi:hypothetical protein
MFPPGEGNRTNVFCNVCNVHHLSVHFFILPFSILFYCHLSLVDINLAPFVIFQD